MTFEEQFRQLATRPESGNLFLSLYLDTARNDEAQRDRIRLMLKEEFRRIRDAIGNGNGMGVDGELEKGIHQIEQYVSGSLLPGTRSVAIFTCPNENFFVPVQLPVTIAPQLSISTRPRLRPLVQLRQANPPLAVAMVDAQSARIFELELGRVLHEIDLTHPGTPRRHDQGGWSQANLQRHAQEHVDRNQKEDAEVLVRMVDQGGIHSVVLSGQERNVANFRGFLPKRVAERVIGTLHLEMRSLPEEIIAGCRALVATHHASRLGARLERMEEAAKKHDRGALGFDAVIDAVNQRKIEHLFLSDRAIATGWICTHCQMLGRAVPLGCPVCGNGVLTADLVEELISGTRTENATLELVDGPSVLDRYDGVGALLRF
jgi:peptide chain release factor subunit 1